MRHLLVEDADEGSVSLTLTAGSTKVTGVASIPHLELLRTGVAELLVAGREAELARRAGRYASILAAGLERALGPDIQLAIGGLRVEVRCWAAAQSLVWETLRLLGDETDPVRVFRTLPELDPVPDATNGAELIWLAARKVDDRISRYRVAGPVLGEIRMPATITPRWVSTASTPETVRSLPRRVPPAPGRARIVHLDVHGGTHAKPGDDLVDPGFVARFGVETMDDRELEEILEAIGCVVFVSNACHSGDLRDTHRLPFAARLLTRGSAGALVARGPVPEQSTMDFHRYLYAALARGMSLLDAHAGAVDHAATVFPNDRDQAARAVVQPMLWVRTTAIADTSVCSVRLESDPRTDQLVDLYERSLGAVQLHILAENGILASAMAAAEQVLDEGQPMPQPIFIDSELSEESGRGMADTMRWALGAQPEQASSGKGLVLRVPPIRYEERLALLRLLFASSSPLLDVLAVCLPGDPLAVAAAAQLSDRDPVRALLRAGEMGQMTGELSEIMAEGAAVARKVLAPFPDDVVHRAMLAVPMLGVGTDCQLASLSRSLCKSVLDFGSEVVSGVGFAGSVCVFAL